MFRTWIEVLIKPKETFRKEINNENPATELIKTICFAGVIAGVMYAAIFILFDIPSAVPFNYGSGGKIIYGAIMVCSQ